MYTFCSNGFMPLPCGAGMSASVSKNGLKGFLRKTRSAVKNPRMMASTITAWGNSSRCRFPLARMAIELNSESSNTQNSKLPSSEPQNAVTL